MTIAQSLAEFVVSTPYEAIPGIAIERAKMSLASTVASASAGFGIESAAMVRKLELAEGGGGRATVWFDGTPLPASRAVRVNAMASDAAASDDSDLRSIAHIGTIASTVSVAIAQQLGRSGQDVLGAMVLGYEVAGRIDEALTPGRMQRGFHGSVSTVFASAVASGKLLGLTAGQMAQAISLAATSIGGMAIAADTSCAREYHAGLSAMLGVQATLAAQQGFQSDTGVLELPRGFFSAMGGQDIDAVAQGLGHSWDIVTDMAIKLMPGAHPFHAVAEAAATAAHAAGLNTRSSPMLSDVARIDVSAAVQWTKFKGEPHPRNLVDAAHSIFYFVAASIADGGFDWQHMHSEKMCDPVIAALQEKVVLDPAPPPLPDRFPHRHGGTVTITMRDGQSFSSTCVAPRGSGPRGVLWSDVEAKYRHLAPRSGLSERQVRESFDVICQLDRIDDISVLTRLLVLPRP